MTEKEADNFFKKFYRRGFWISSFFYIPVFLYLLIQPLTNSFEISIISAIAGFGLYVFLFFHLGIHKTF